MPGRTSSWLYTSVTDINSQGDLSHSYLTSIVLYYIIINAAHNPQEDIDRHEYDYVENETTIETKECAAYAVQKNMDLESNPAYIIYTQIADQVTTVEMTECTAYGTQDKVITEANPAYQQSQCTCNNN